MTLWFLNLARGKSQTTEKASGEVREPDGPVRALGWQAEAES
jgi:hypothetical protein